MPQLNSNVGFNPTQLLTAAGQIAGSATDPTGFHVGAPNGSKFGFVSNNVTGFIRALETIGSTKILASPRILVLEQAASRNPAWFTTRIPDAFSEFHQHDSASPVPEHGHSTPAPPVRLGRRDGPDGDPSRA